MTFISNHKLVQPQLILKKKVEPAEVEEKEEQNKQETTSTNNQPTIILDDSFKLKAYQVQEMTKLLQKGFTKTDIDKYFEWNSETKKYEMKPDIQINGQNVSSEDQLLALLIDTVMEKIDNSINKTYEIFNNAESDKTTNVEETDKSNSTTNSDSIVEVDGIKVDCSAFGTYIKTLPITKNTSTAIILNGYKEQLKSQYGDKLSDDVFNTIYEQTVAEN